MSFEYPVRKFLLSLIAVGSTLHLGLAGPIPRVTVGFENLANWFEDQACEQNGNYNFCGMDSRQPYRVYGMTFENSVLSNRIFHSTYGDASNTPYGSYYMLAPAWNEAFQTGAQKTSFGFVIPGTTIVRTVNYVSFLVLGLQGDVIRNGGAYNLTGRFGQLASANVTCDDPELCPNYSTGFTAIARDVNGVEITRQTVQPLNQGEAGYRTGDSNTTDYRVTISSTTGFSSVDISNLVPAYLLDNSRAYGGILIDQITFDDWVLHPELFTAPTDIPEPGTFTGVGLAVAGVIAWRRRSGR